MALIRQGSWAYAAEGTPVVAGVPPTFEDPFAGGTWAAFLGAANAGILAEGEWVARAPWVAFRVASQGADEDRAVAPVAAAAAAVGSCSTLRERLQVKEQSL